VREDPRYLKGVELFNNEDFFEAHEVWEDLWHETRGEARDFVQGLIQVASSFHHLRNGNMRGARILHDTGLELLAPYGDSYLGADLKGLKAGFDAALRGILEPPLERLAGRGHPGPVKIDYAPERAPKLRLS
jgi:uncharacterized protein